MDSVMRVAIESSELDNGCVELQCHAVRGRAWWKPLVVVAPDGTVMVFVRTRQRDVTEAIAGVARDLLESLAPVPTLPAKGAT